MRWLALVIGVFYVVGGLIVLRRLALGRTLDAALEQISGEKIAASEKAQTRMLVAGAALTFAGGLALMTLSHFAVPLFLLSLVWQAVYLLVARRAWPPQDAQETAGRRATVNAFFVYVLASALVVSMELYGVLRPWPLPFAPHWCMVVEPTFIMVVTAGVFWEKLRLGATP